MTQLRRVEPLPMNPGGAARCRLVELTPGCASSHLHDLVQILGGDADTVNLSDALSAVTVRRVDDDEVLVHEGASAHALYVVRSGSLKCVKTLEDGYEQVLSLAQAGDVIGFDALCTGHQPATVVALEISTVFALQLQGLHDLRHRCPALDTALELALSRQLVRAAELTEIMAAVAADVRLARFLLWMTGRMATIGQSPRRLRLRLCRRDIASLLGVAHETVSRGFTAMADAGYLKVDNREVEILDLARLQTRARSTREPQSVPRGMVSCRPSSCSMP